MWFCVGFFIGVLLTQLPLPASPFSKELRKDSETLHEFIVNDSNVIVNESKAIAGATAAAAIASDLALTGKTLKSHGGLLNPVPK